MALIGTLRNKMGKVLVVVLSLVMIVFVGGEFFTQLGLGGQQIPDIAKIAGKSISNTRFQNKVDELSFIFAVNSGRNPQQQETEQIRDQAWNALVFEEAYQIQLDELGIEVTNNELIDMVQGSNISPQIIQFFSDPNTGIFDKSNVTKFLASLPDAEPQRRNSWIAFENSLIPSRLAEKYNNLLQKTNYATQYEAKEVYNSQNANASIEYAFVPFQKISDSLVNISDKEMKVYIDTHANEFKRDETRDLEYVVFDIQPSPSDSIDVLEEVIDLRDDLISAINDSTFVSVNSDDVLSFLTYSIDNLPDSLRGKDAGYVSQPVINNGSYEFYKLSRVDKPTPDSLLYRVAKIKKDISLYISDETVNKVYRTADLFAASSGNLEEFRKNAQDQNLSIIKGSKLTNSTERVGALREARGLVSWLYNEAEVGSVSGVKEIDNQYVVAVMTSEQPEGTANLNDVRNQVERKVRNEKKAELVIAKLNKAKTEDMTETAEAYGEEAKSGVADVQLFSNSINGIGYCPEGIGLAFSLDEEEVTNAFAIQDGVIVMKLIAKEFPSDIEDYSQYALQATAQRLGGNALIADFPLSYFRLFVSSNLDNAVKELAEIEDMRYKFF